MQACSGSHDVAVTNEHRKHTSEVNTNLNMNLTSDYWVYLSNKYNMEQINKAAGTAAPSKVLKKEQTPNQQQNNSPQETSKERMQHAHRVLHGRMVLFHAQETEWPPHFSHLLFQHHHHVSTTHNDTQSRDVEDGVLCPQQAP